jgi:hypothetical protein
VRKQQLVKRASDPSDKVVVLLASMMGHQKR